MIVFCAIILLQEGDILKALVFDLDGTLLNTIEDLRLAVNNSIGLYGYRPISLQQAKNYIGNGIRKLVERSIDYDLTHLDEAYNEFISYYNKNYNVYTMPYDGINTLLEYAKNKGYLLACVSNKNIVPLRYLINAHFDGYFMEVIGDGEGFQRKPDPETLFEIAKRLNVNISDIIYIGDSDIDVETVKNAKCDGIFVSYGYRHKEDLIKAGAKIICSTPLEIIDVLEKEYGYRND